MSSSEYAHLLKRIPLFKDCSEEELGALGGMLQKREFSKDGTILQRDEPGDALFVIVKGKVKVVLYGETGREIILSILQDGDFFGEMALVDGSTRSASVVAQTSSQLLVLKRQDFINQVMQKPEIGLKVLTEMSSRLREADEKIGTLALYDVYGRLARLLIHLAEREGEEKEDGVLIAKRPTHQDLAAMIGTSRETVSRALSDFAKRGLIQMEGKQIFISSAALQEFEHST